PLWTISALAERCAVLMAQDRGWSFDYELPSRPAKPDEAVQIGLQFTERMAGYFSDRVDLDNETAAQEGKKQDYRVSFIGTVIADNADRMLNKSPYTARVLGVVEVPGISAVPMTISDGECQLLAEEPQSEGPLQVTYRMKLTSSERKTYYLH